MASSGEGMARMVPGYSHLPGDHCGSTALRNLLAFGGAPISEELAFGLGAGAAFYYLALDDISPSRWFSGRTARLEESFRELTGAAIDLRTFGDDADASWEAARAEVDAGRPVLLLTDIYHLDHYGNSAHFPGHAVVLAGYDETTAFLSDTAFEQLQETSLEHLAVSRHGDHLAYPLAGHMFTLAGPVSEAALREAAPAAIARAAAEMLEPAWSPLAGLPAVRKLAEEAASWPDVAEDWRWCARFGYQVIERRGTGGGAFRFMYSRFLAEVGNPHADLAAAAGERWRELAEAFRDAGEPEAARAADWKRVGEAAGACAAAEERLWSALG